MYFVDLLIKSYGRKRIYIFSISISLKMRFILLFLGNICSVISGDTIYDSGVTFKWYNFKIMSSLGLSSASQPFAKVMTSEDNRTLNFNFKSTLPNSQTYPDQKITKLTINETIFPIQLSSPGCLIRNFTTKYADQYGGNFVSYLQYFLIITLKNSLKKVRFYFYLSNPFKPIALTQIYNPYDNLNYTYNSTTDQLIVIHPFSHIDKNFSNTITFQIKSLLNMLSSAGQIDSKDTITELSYIIKILSGAGTLNITINENNSYAQKIVFNGHSFVNQIFNGLTCGDISQTHFVDPQHPEINGAKMTFSSAILSSGPLKAYQYIAKNIESNTVQNDLLRLKALKVNLSYNAEGTNIGVQDCISIIFKDNQSKQKSQPSAQMLICGKSVQKSTNNSNIFFSNQNTYVREHLSSSPYQQPNLKSWPTFKYYNLASVFASDLANFDLIPFFKDINSSFSLLNLQIYELRAGFAFYYGSGNFTINSLDMFYFFQLTLEEHKTQMYENFTKAIGTGMVKATTNIISIPSVGSLMKVTPLIGLVDDFSYFVYYNSSKVDTAFSFVSELCWNWTHSKWQLPKPIAETLGLDLSSTQSQPQRWLKDTKGITPVRLAYRTEDLFFLNNCKGYLLYTVPFSTLIFIVLWKLYWRFRQKKCISALTSFSSFAYLLASLVGENTQFLAFKCFQQLRFIVPLYGSVYYLNLLLTFSVLFLCLLCTVCLYILAWNMARQTFRHMLFQRSLKSFQILGVLLVTKFISGFIHAYLQDQLIQMVLLFLVQTMTTFSLYYSSYAKIIKNKLAFNFLIAGQIFRVALHILLIQQVMHDDEISIKQDIIIGQITLTLVLTIVFCNVFQIVFTILGGIWLKNKQVQFQKNTSNTSISLQNQQNTRQIKRQKSNTFIDLIRDLNSHQAPIASNRKIRNNRTRKQLSKRIYTKSCFKASETRENIVLKIIPRLTEKPGSKRSEEKIQ